MIFKIICYRKFKNVTVAYDFESSRFLNQKKFMFEKTNQKLGFFVTILLYLSNLAFLSTGSMNSTNSYFCVKFR